MSRLFCRALYLFTAWFFFTLTMCSVADEDEEGGLEAELAAEKAADPMNELVAGMAAEKAELAAEKAADPMNELAEIQEDTVAEAEVEKGAQASTLAKEVVDTQEHWKEPAKRPGPGDYETGQSTLSVRGGVIGRAPRFGADKDGKEGTGAGSGANRRCESPPRSPPDRPTDATRFVDADHTGASKTTKRGAGRALEAHLTSLGLGELYETLTPLQRSTAEEKLKLEVQRQRGGELSARFQQKAELLKYQRARDDISKMESRLRQELAKVRMVQDDAQTKAVEAQDRGMSLNNEIVKYQRAREDCQKVASTLRVELTKCHELQNDLSLPRLLAELDSLRNRAKMASEFEAAAAVERQQADAYRAEAANLMMHNAELMKADLTRRDDVVLMGELQKFVLRDGEKLLGALDELAHLRRTAVQSPTPIEQLAYEFAYLRNRMLAKREANRSKNLALGRSISSKELATRSPPARPASAALLAPRAASCHIETGPFTHHVGGAHAYRAPLGRPKSAHGIRTST